MINNSFFISPYSHCTNPYGTLVHTNSPQQTYEFPTYTHIINVPLQYQFYMNVLTQQQKNLHLYDNAMQARASVLQGFDQNLPYPSQAPLLDTTYWGLLKPEGNLCKMLNTYNSLLSKAFVNKNTELFNEVLNYRAKIMAEFNNSIPYPIQSQLMQQTAIENSNGVPLDTIYKWFFNLNQMTANETFINIDYNPNVVHRFPNIHCVKETAVKVDSYPFYLHANYMTKLKNETSSPMLQECSKRFVATQLPLYQAQAHFWKKIFQEEALIVDLTGDKDIKDGSDIYYPQILNEVKVITKDVSVELIKINGNFRTYKVIVEGEQKEILRFQFKEWGDFSATSIPNLHNLVKILDSALQENIWIHCKAGAGRTGNLIGIFLINQGILNGAIGPNNLEESVNKIMLILRNARCKDLLQTKEQYASLVRYAESLF